MANKKKVEVTHFSPYHAIVKFNGTASTSGINWSYAEFTKEVDCRAFASACNVNGYRTRNISKQTDIAGTDTWSVQYHHYED